MGWAKAGGVQVYRTRALFRLIRPGLPIRAWRIGRGDRGWPTQGSLIPSTRTAVPRYRD